MINRGTSQQESAPYNRRIVLDVIRRAGEVSRKEIVDVVSLSPQTVANITQSLESNDLIVSKRRKAEKSRGQPPIVFALNPEGGCSIGIALEPGLASGALVNLVGEVIAVHEIDVNASDQEQCLNAMIRIVEFLSSKNKSAKQIWGIGVALPGPFDAEDLSFVGPTTIEGWKDLSLLDELNRATGYQVYYSVDSVAGALGESLFGIAKNISCFYYLHLGVGLGGTLVNQGAAYKGSNGNATEIGHIPVVPGGKPCYCGNRGCLERYLSLFALYEALEHEGIKVNSKVELNELLLQNNKIVLVWVKQAAEYLRGAICILENILDPQAIIIGGSAPRGLVEAVLRSAQPWAKSVRGGIAEPCERLMLSSHQEYSPVLGAAVLPVYEMLSPHIEAIPREPSHNSNTEELLGLNTVKKVRRL
ncbi:MAG: putative NBD/HSP70 family sugar kinase [Flavobacteriales bacterium]|jgi:predicted NBD/HSP70 family sugar kinase